MPAAQRLFYQHDSIVCLGSYAHKNKVLNQQDLPIILINLNEDCLASCLLRTVGHLSGQTAHLSGQWSPRWGKSASLSNNHVFIESHFETLLSAVSTDTKQCYHILCPILSGFQNLKTHPKPLNSAPELYEYSPEMLLTPHSACLISRWFWWSYRRVSSW